MQSQMEGELDWLNSSNARPCIICFFESSFILLKIMLLLYVWQTSTERPTCIKWLLAPAYHLGGRFMNVQLLEYLSWNYMYYTCTMHLFSG